METSGINESKSSSVGLGINTKQKQETPQTENYTNSIFGGGFPGPSIETSAANL